ncbi:Predicted acetyltransferase [Friedmanniella luteola]|uniref:Predicted acetyltransferase n=1 Tax=Friedmanniella luteola TaxID=546871 RepID=A0A1H2AAV3_9ACTN|nr:GNAT family N-acetyltransferase [Friedmanniella luteola]SDT43088.1 Predicted acetyltransferase [Friedmanniella luteola]
MATAPHLAHLELSPLPAEGAEDFLAATTRGFHQDYDADAARAARGVLEPERCFGYAVDGRWMATCGSYTRVMTVPGGTVPTAAVTFVTVNPGYRRRGLLTQMMSHQLRGLAEHGEPVALLWASESAIYGRYGYGPATPLVQLEGATLDTAFRSDVDLGAGSVGEVDREECRRVVEGLHARLLPDRPGALDRPSAWWDAVFFDHPSRRHGGAAARYALHFDARGRPDGYLTFRLSSAGTADPGPGHTVRVAALDASDLRGYARLWRFALDLDLVRRFEGPAALDEPLRHLVADPASVRATSTDGTYVRVVDVARALEARRYALDVDLVLGVRDALLPQNAGSYRLQGGPDGASVQRVDTPADVELDVRELGTLYLGGTPAAELHRAGLLHERTPGAVAALSLGFSWSRKPFCRDYF